MGSRLAWLVEFSGHQGNGFTVQLAHGLRRQVQADADLLIVLLVAMMPENDVSATLRQVVKHLKQTLLLEPRLVGHGGKRGGQVHGRSIIVWQICHHGRSLTYEATSCLSARPCPDSRTALLHHPRES